MGRCYTCGRESADNGPLLHFTDCAVAHWNGDPRPMTDGERAWLRREIDAGRLTITGTKPTTPRTPPMLERLIARLFGRVVVYLLDFDGEVTKRWAKVTPFGLVCRRMWPGGQKCLLLPGGVVNGPRYVHGWREGRGDGG